METINSTDIIKGISRFLKANYPEFEIYEISPEQKLKLPCFIIEQGNSTVNRRYVSTRVGTYSLDRETFAIRILCNEVRKLRDTAFDLRIRFNEIETPSGSILPKDKRTNVSADGKEMVLTFFILLDTLIPVDKDPAMDTFSINQKSL